MRHLILGACLILLAGAVMTSRIAVRLKEEAV